MPSFVGVVVTAAVALSLVAGVPAFQSQTQPTPAAPPSTVDTARPEQFVGTWTYNADESVNAYTGRPEQAPTRAEAVRQAQELALRGLALKLKAGLLSNEDVSEIRFVEVESDELD